MDGRFPGESVFKNERERQFGQARGGKPYWHNGLQSRVFVKPIYLSSVTYKSKAKSERIVFDFKTHLRVSKKGSRRLSKTIL